MGTRRLMYTVLIVLLIVLLLLLVLNRVRKNRYRNTPTPPTSQETTTTPPITPSDSSLVKRISVLVDRVGGRVDWSHKNDLITFSKKGLDGYADIYTMNEDESNQVCLTCGKSEIPQLSNDQPEWHPSGEYIVFESQDPNLGALPKAFTEGGAGLNNNLWIVTRDGNKFYQLTHIKTGEASLHPHFSHDGKKLFWAARVVPGLGKGYWALKIADFVVASSGPKLTNEKEYRPIKDFGFYESHSFSLDDKTIYFSASKSATSFDLDIYKMALDSGIVTNLTNTPGEWDEHSILSPSGKKLVWISSQGYDFKPAANWGATLKTDLWVMGTDGSNKQKVTHFNEPGFSEYNGSRVILADSAWNTDGTKLVVASFVEGIGTRIWLIEFKEPQ